MIITRTGHCSPLCHFVGWKRCALDRVRCRRRVPRVDQGAKEIPA